ncbi:MAG: tellurium resistance protein TerC [Verrucomicrobia bacterium RIFCSPLOWO2_12_FULL_64_8]|nr:MAG: tellurium resistance protein TerC [Verrucomicrobia bacterium RIFCSPLOWO2_12_FULL_64_8]
MHPELQLTSLDTPGGFLLAILSIILIDIVLAGDNAVVIALAVRTLPPVQRKWGIVLGAGMAVVLRVALTTVAAQLLGLNYVKLIGGVLILWIAVKLLLQDAENRDAGGKVAGNLWQAVWIIMVADITMSLDNVLAVAGASKGHFGLLLFGLGLSIPLVVFTSNLLARLMDRYPLIVYLGAAVLGKVGGEMIMTDPVVFQWVEPEPGLVRSVEVLMAVGVIGVALLLRKRSEPPPKD